MSRLLITASSDDNDIFEYSHTSEISSPWDAFEGSTKHLFKYSIRE